MGSKKALHYVGYGIGMVTMSIGGKQTRFIPRLILCISGWALCMYAIEKIEEG